jgi:ABC-type dipeptide/oligopeptide/nickel transport system permease subunit
MSDNAIRAGISEVPPRVNETKRFLKVFFGRKLVLFGSIIILLFVITAIFGPLFAPYDPYEQQFDQVLISPAANHLFGTDHLGRDTLSRMIYGSRNSLMVGVVALAIAAVIGMTGGMLAGYFGGWVNIIIMRIVDAMMSFPMILLALLIAALLGGGLLNVMIAIGISMIPGYVRLMCGLVLSAKESDYILAGLSLGSSNLRLMIKHILPNCFPPLIVLITIQIGAAILSEAGLSYLGIGITPPAPAWGAMVNEGYKYLVTNPILSFIPGVSIMLVVFAFNMVGDGLRDALDPRLSGLL